MLHGYSSFLLYTPLTYSVGELLQLLLLLVLLQLFLLLLLIIITTTTNLYGLCIGTPCLAPEFKLVSPLYLTILGRRRKVAPVR